jgi:MoaA/NifB/PqqE/SkfB family radical SAM enzyme
MSKQLSSIVYEITQDCPFRCPICLRYDHEEKRPTPYQWKTMIKKLKELEIGRITLTGGEPAILGKELYDFLKYAHRKKIHICLCTTGLYLSPARILEMDGYLDQILLSVRSFELHDWLSEYGDLAVSRQVFQNIETILDCAKKTNIIWVINYVLHKKNIDRVLDFGKKLASINPQVTWRISEFYGIGMGSKVRSEYELTNEEFSYAKAQVNDRFTGIFHEIMFLSKNRLAKSSEFVITPSGNLITTNAFNIQTTQYNILSGLLPESIKSPRPWSAFLKACRDWGWGDFEASGQD